jgi:hypothetical protein
MNFDRFITELACIRDMLIKVCTTGWASMNIVVDEVAITMLV